MFLDHKNLHAYSVINIHYLNGIGSPIGINHNEKASCFDHLLSNTKLKIFVTMIFPPLGVTLTNSKTKSNLQAIVLPKKVLYPWAIVPPKDCTFQSLKSFFKAFNLSTRTKLGVIWM